MRINYLLIAVLLTACTGNKHVAVFLVNQTNVNLEVTLFSTFDYPIKLPNSVKTDSIFIKARLFQDSRLSIQILNQDSINFLTGIEVLDDQGGSIISVYDDEKQMYHSTFWIAPQQKILVYRALELYLRNNTVPIDGLHIHRMDARKTLELELNSGEDIYKRFHLDKKEQEIEISIGR